MEASILQKFSPFIIFFLSALSAISFPKVFYIGLPAMAVCLYLYYPNSWWVQIALLIIWGLLLIGTYRVEAFSLIEIRDNKLLFTALIALSTIATTLLLIWWNPINTWDLDSILFVILCMAFGTAIFYHGLVKPIAMYVVAPLFVKSKTTINATLTDYYKIAVGRPHSKLWHSHIRFLGDPFHYEIGVLGFRRYRNKVDVPFSYIRCKCLFGVHYIYAVKQLSQTVGRPSKWESSPTDQFNEKIKKYVLIFAIGSVVLALITIGIAVLYKTAL